MESVQNIKKTFEDYQACKENPKIMAQLDEVMGEKVIFSCQVVKFNRFGMNQERTLLLTNQNLYNIKKD